MPENTSFSSNVDTLFTDLQNFVKTDTVLGAPLVVEDKTLVPLMSITVGYGSTGMGAKAQVAGNTNTSAGGHGLGARVSTSGVIVIDKNNVQLLSTNDNSKMGQMMDKIPQALASMGQNMMGGSNQGQQQNQQNQQGGGQNQPTDQSWEQPTI